MNKTRSTLAGLMAFAALSASAQHPIVLPASTAGLLPGQAKHLSQKLNAALHIVSAGPQQKGAGGNDKLMAESTYDFSKPAGSQVVDSFQLTYNGTRGTAYDFFNMQYNIGNDADYPVSGIPLNTGYVQFDTMRRFDLSNGNQASIGAVRLYNAAGKPTSFEYPGDPSITYFYYDASGKLIKALYLDGSGGMGLDSSSRDFYTYNSSGYVVSDSTETWDPSSGWTEESMTATTNNASGYPILQRVRVNTPFGKIIFADLTSTYSSSNDLIRNVIRVRQSLTGPLQNYRKDTFAYTSGMMTLNDAYAWDTTANNWALRFQDIRRLNTALLPDSVWQNNLATGGNTADTNVYKLLYNANGSPTVKRHYGPTGRSLMDEDRYYYSLPPALSVAKAAKLDISVYPNPASTELRINGIAGARFSMINTAGQLIAKGQVLQGNRIPVSGLAPGTYQLIVTDNMNTPHAVRFVKE